MDKKDQQSTTHKQIPGWINFLVGGGSGILATSVVQPADLVKTRMQLSKNAKNTSVVTVASDILRREGPAGFYRGLSAALFRQVTYTTARLGFFNAVFDYYKSNFGLPNFGVKLLIGVTAGGIGALFGNPAEICLIRMTADGRLPPEQRRNYKNVFNAIRRIVREEGVTVLWQGTGATITRSAVVNGAQLSTYQQSREMLLPMLGDSLFLHFYSSMISGFVTSLASLPVDIVKTRVQNATKGTSQTTVFLDIIRNEGSMALWSGFLPTFAKIGPHTVITFIFMEQLNSLFIKMA